MARRRCPAAHLLPPAALRLAACALGCLGLAAARRPDPTHGLDFEPRGAEEPAFGEGPVAAQASGAQRAGEGEVEELRKSLAEVQLRLAATERELEASQSRARRWEKQLAEGRDGAPEAAAGVQQLTMRAGGSFVSRVQRVAVQHTNGSSTRAGAAHEPAKVQHAAAQTTGSSTAPAVHRPSAPGKENLAQQGTILENSFGDTLGAVFMCPDGSDIPNDGFAVCPGSLTCASIDCPHHSPGFVNRTLPSKASKVYCNKFGCRSSCCRLDCSSLDGHPLQCDSKGRCAYDGITGFCREKVECDLDPTDEEKLMLLTSKGLAGPTGIDPENRLEVDVVRAFRELVAVQQRVPLNTSNLMKDLKVLVVGDACYTQEVTSAGWHGCEDFRSQFTLMKDENGQGLHLAAGQVFEIGLFDSTFDPGVAVGGKSAPQSFARTMGNAKYPDKYDSVKGLAEFQRLILEREVFEDPLQPNFPEGLLDEAVEHIRNNKYMPPTEVRKKWGLADNIPLTAVELLENANVLAFNGGNPDFLFWAIRSHPDFLKKMTRQIEHGRTILVGRSAGSMLAGWDVTMSVEEGSRFLFKCGPDGRASDDALRLLGKCTVRPHYSQERWDVAATMHERSSLRRVVRIPNGEAMQCMGGRCRMFGAKRRTGDSDYPDFWRSDCQT